MEYRICENKYGWFKIQELKETKYLFGWPLSYPKWKDAKTYYNAGGDGWVELYETRIDASRIIKDYIEDDEKYNNEWSCKL